MTTITLDEVEGLTFDFATFIDMSSKSKTAALTKDDLTTQYNKLLSIIKSNLLVCKKTDFVVDNLRYLAVTSNMKPFAMPADEKTELTAIFSAICYDLILFGSLKKGAILWYKTVTDDQYLVDLSSYQSKSGFIQDVLAKTIKKILIKLDAKIINGFFQFIKKHSLVPEDRETYSLLFAKSFMCFEGVDRANTKKDIAYLFDICTNNKAFDKANLKKLKIKKVNATELAAFDLTKLV